MFDLDARDSPPVQNYQAISGKTPDELWKIQDIRKVKPSWHGWGGGKRNGGDELAVVPSKGGKGGKKKPLAITNGDESDDSMPSLQTVSDSSDEEDEEYVDDDDDFYDNDEDSEGSDEDYDEDEEDELRDLLREAMDTAVASSDFYNNKGPAPEFDHLAEERKGNPFLKLLGSLRGKFTGRLISANYSRRHRAYVPCESDTAHHHPYPAAPYFCWEEDPDADEERHCAAHPQAFGWRYVDQTRRCSCL